MMKTKKVKHYCEYSGGLPFVYERIYVDGEKDKYRLCQDYVHKLPFKFSKTISAGSSGLCAGRLCNLRITGGVLIVGNGYVWDGASGPTIDTKDSMRGSLVHDALYQLMRDRIIGTYRRKQADLELKRICIEDGMKPFRINYWYFFVRLFAAKHATPPPIEMPYPNLKV
jgi:hypothetical protein